MAEEHGPPPRKGRLRWPRWLAAALVAAVALAAVFAALASPPEPASNGPQQAEERPADAPRPAAAPEPPTDPDPQAESTTNCDYLLGVDGPDRFVAGAAVENTGEVGVVAELRAEWKLLGSEPLVKKKKVRVQPGQSRDVNISVEAQGEQIDAHQSAEGDCEADVKLLDSFNP